MKTIKITRRISSSKLKIRELEKFLNKKVEITISPIPENEKKNIEELLNLSQWNITENDIKVNSWEIPKY